MLSLKATSNPDSHLMSRLTRHLSLLPLWIALCLLTGLTACAPAAAIPTIYRPPTAAAFPSGAEPAAGIPSSPPATPECTNSLRFIEDLTIPDGSLVQPAEQLDKQWLVQNDGTCNWDSRYRLRLIGGPEMGAPVEQALYPARSNTQAIIRILLTAPQSAGVYQSAWQAYTPEGLPFGDAIYIKIVVE